MIAEKAKLITVCDGTRFDYVEPSVACAAHHAISILEHEEGCALAIEANGKMIWEWDPKASKKTCAALEKLAVGECAN